MLNPCTATKSTHVHTDQSQNSQNPQGWVSERYFLSIDPEGWRRKCQHGIAPGAHQTLRSSRLYERWDGEDEETVMLSSP